MKAVSGIALAAALCSGTTCFAVDPIVWDNGPPLVEDFGGGPGYFLLGISLEEGSSNAVADDFLLTQDTFITAASWSGFVNHTGFPGPDLPAAFVLRFYTSDPSGTTPTNFGPGPGLDPISTAIAEYVIPHADLTVAPDPIFPPTENLHFQAELPTPFIAQAGVNYWFSVSAQFTTSGSYRFIFSSLQQLNVPALTQNGEPWSSISFPSPDFLPPSDMVFGLYGTPVPAPGALGAIGLAGLLKLRRRK